MKTAVSRDGTDARMRGTVERTGKKVGFDGLLNAFLDKKTTGKAGASQSGASGGTAKQGANRSGSGLKAADRQSGRRDADKPDVSGKDDPTEEAAENGRLSAAEEAANLIWDLLYGPGAVPGLEVGADPLSTRLAHLSGLLRGTGAIASGTLSGLDGGVEAGAMQNAIETANASAEMNQAAVRAALDELLEGVPPGALREALARAAGERGLDNPGEPDMIDAVAEALRADVIGVNTMGGAELLSQLASSAGMRVPSMTAENAGLPFTSQDLLHLFQQFIAEKYGTVDAANPANSALSPDPKALAAVADSFAAWLHESGNSHIAKELSSNGPKLKAMLTPGTGYGGEGDWRGNSDKNSFVTQNLEKVLHSFAAKTAGDNAELSPDANAGGVFRANPGQGLETASPAGLGAGVFAAATGQTPPQQAAPQNTQLSSMLVQIENIERMAEAMRMVGRNGMSNITMQLAPAELGRMLLRVEARGGVVSAFLKVEKAETVARLAGSLGQLRETLKGMGFELGELDIEHRPQDGTATDAGGGRRGSDHAAESSGSGADARRGQGEAEPDEPDESPRAAPGGGNNDPGQLNLFA